MLINEEGWNEISDDMDAQTAYNKFEKNYLKHYNSVSRLKSSPTRRKNERQFLSRGFCHG